MAHPIVYFLSRQATHKPILGWRVAFWALVILAAVLSITGESSLQVAPAPASQAIALSFAGPSSQTMNPIAIEPEFQLQFLQEKRDAKSEELPAQF